MLAIDGRTEAYEALPDGSVVRALKAKIGEAWVIKVDVVGPSEQPDERDRRKVAFSDALKRAAVKLGIDRYLYRLPRPWVDWDAQKRQSVRVPTLPAWALPAWRPAVNGQPARPATARRDGGAL